MSRLALVFFAAVAVVAVAVVAEAQTQPGWLGPSPVGGGLSSLTIGTTPVGGGTPGDCLTVTTGPVLNQASCGTATTITVGTTNVASGTSGDIEYNNAGVLGEKTPTGTGSVVLATSPSIATPTITGSFTATGLVTAADLFGTTGSGGNVVLATSPSIATPTITGSFTATGLVTAADLFGTTGSGGNVVLATGPSISGLTVTSSFTATGLVTTADLAAAAVTYAKIQNGGANGLLLVNSGAAPSELGVTNGDCVVGSAGAWTAGNCGGTGVGVQGGQNIQTYGDVNQTLASAKYVYATSATLTAARTWTLPTSSTQGAGDLEIIDAAQGITSSNTLTVAAGGTDKLNGTTNGTLVLYSAGGAVRIHNDGAGNYTVVSSLICASPGASQILVSNASSQCAWGTALPNGTTATTQSANDNSTKVATTAYVDKPVNFATPGSSHSFSGNTDFFVCTTTCTVTPPTPTAGGQQYCARNDNNVTTVITFAAISGVQYETTAFTSYKTANTSIVSGGAAGDKLCVISRDATHYLVASYNGTWS